MRRFLRHFIPLALALASLSTAAAAAPMSPEQEIALLARNLRPIPDDRWKEIAGTKTSETYKITQGDTLYDISKRLFGDARYWPKIWALNNPSITNPHLIRPGKTIAFMPGTGTSLPAVAIADASDSKGGSTAAAELGQTVTDAEPEVDAVIPMHSGRSQEWRRLPRQDWEDLSMPIVPAKVEVETVGVENRATAHPRVSRDLTYFLSAEDIQPLGDLSAAISTGKYLGSYELVYLRTPADASQGAEIREGQSYTITRTKPFRVGGVGGAEVYNNLGRVKILSKRGDLWLGRITSAKYPITRGDVLVPLRPRVGNMAPVPASKEVAGKLLINRSDATFYTSQYREAFVNRGSGDGVEVGMIFRAYHEIDRATGARIADRGFVSEADFQVVETTDHYCHVVALSGINAIEDSANVVLLTDVSSVSYPIDAGTPSEAIPTPDEGQTQGQDQGQGGLPNAQPSANPQAIPQASPRPNDDDELDHLNGDDLRPDEERELRQLENWKQNPAKPGEPPAPGDVAPPPPAEGSSAGPEAPPPPPPPMDEPPKAEPDRKGKAAADEELPPPPPPSEPAPSAGSANEPAPPPPPPAMDAAPPPPPGPGSLTPNSAPDANPPEDFLPPPPPPPN